MTRRGDEDFQQEIESHIAIEADRLMAEGVDPESARQMARRKFGNVAAAQERFYEWRRILWLDELRQDVSYAIRALRRSPGFAAVAILTLALGIGANTAIFSVVNSVLLRPLPYRDPGSLVLIEPGEVGLTPDFAIQPWRERAGTLSALAGFNGPRTVTLIDRGTPEGIQSTTVTWDFLSFLGVRPAIGRDFTEADASRGAAAVAILSDDVWRRQFGGSADVVGRTVTLGGDPITIVGVMGSAFRFPTAGALPAFDLPVDLQPDLLRVWSGQNSLNVIGRLRSGASREAASSELLAILRQEGKSEFSQSFLDRMQLGVVPLQDRLVGDLSRRLWLVMGAVAFVLLVACTNVANLLLARASTRHRELAVRTALGARRGRLVRLLLTESTVLALIGSAGALAIAFLSRGVARTLLADRIPHVAAIGLDWTVLGFNVGLAAATGLLCGLASLPGFRRVKPASVLADGATPAVTGRSGLRRALLSVETAVTFVLVVGAALMVQTLWNLSRQDKGFNPEQLLTVRVAPGLPREIDRRDPRASRQYFADFFTDLTGRLGRLPGVASAGAISLGPLQGTSSGLCCVLVEGGPAFPEENTLTPVGFVAPGYFQTMGIRVAAGRDFDARDRLGAERVAIVNQAFVRKFVPGPGAVGARITDLRRTGEQDFTIVGVTEDVPDKSLREPPEPHIILPLAQMPGGFISWGALMFVLRSEDGDPRRLASAVRREIWSINPNIVISGVATMDERVAAGMRSERDSALLFGLFAVAALVMAAIGVYGVAAYAIAQRTKEIGIRMALGAAKRDVSRLVVWQTLGPTAMGIAIGIAGAAVAVRLVSSMVYGVEPLDPMTFVAAVAVLTTVALAATWAPARRAMRIDPLVALRYE